MPTRNISLSDQFDSFIASGIEEGRYGNASEVVREGLRLLQQREAEDCAKIEWLRGTTQDAIDSIERGEGKSFTLIDVLTDHLSQLRIKTIGTISNSKKRCLISRLCEQRFHRGGSRFREYRFVE